MFSMDGSATTAFTGSLQAELKLLCKVNRKLAFFPAQIHADV